MRESEGERERVGESEREREGPAPARLLPSLCRASTRLSYRAFVCSCARMFMYRDGMVHGYGLESPCSPRLSSWYISLTDLSEYHREGRDDEKSRQHRTLVFCLARNRNCVGIADITAKSLLKPEHAAFNTPAK